MDLNNFETYLHQYSKLQLIYCVISLCQIIQSYDKGLTLDEIKKDLDKYIIPEGMI